MSQYYVPSGARRILKGASTLLKWHWIQDSPRLKLEPWYDAVDAHGNPCYRCSDKAVRWTLGGALIRSSMSVAEIIRQSTAVNSVAIMMARNAVIMSALGQTSPMDPETPITDNPMKWLRSFELATLNQGSLDDLMFRSIEYLANRDNARKEFDRCFDAWMTADTNVYPGIKPGTIRIFRRKE